MFKKIFKIPVFRLYFSNDRVRLHIGLIVTLILNILYSAFNAFLTIYYRSLWYGAITIYYIFITVVRYVVFYINKRKDKHEIEASGYKAFRLIGFAMFVINIAMATIIIYNLTDKSTENRSLFVIIALSSYSVCMLLVNLVSIIRKRRKRTTGAYIMARIISFSASFVSLLNLWDSIAARLMTQGIKTELLSGTVGVILLSTVIFLNFGIITGYVFPKISYNESSGNNR